MLLTFAVENWMSFEKEAVFSMVASSERQHSDRLSRVSKYDLKILPIAAVYGANASGKSNLFRALHFVKTLVTRQSQRESPKAFAQPFRLNSKSIQKPTRFRIEMLIDETIYELSFTIQNGKVIEEKLVKITSTSERELYRRQLGKIRLAKSLNTTRMKYAFEGTREGQLYLSNCVSQRIEIFNPIYSWFDNTLELIAPDDRFEPFESLSRDPKGALLDMLLQRLDTGITHLDYEPMDSIPQSIKDAFHDLKENGRAILVSPFDERLFISKHNGELVAKKLMTYHSTTDGEMARFDLRHESDGSKRVIDLLPAFIDLCEKGSNKVYVIDELDRSLHTVLSRHLLELYLHGCTAQTRTQLMFTTHDVLLMEQNLLRRDEMWITERGRAGASTLSSFSEYRDVRYDKDIRKSYLQGRLGGIPRLSAVEFPSVGKQIQ